MLGLDGTAAKMGEAAVAALLALYLEQSHAMRVMEVVMLPGP